MKRVGPLLDILESIGKNKLKPDHGLIEWTDTTVRIFPFDLYLTTKRRGKQMSADA